MYLTQSNNSQTSTWIRINWRGPFKQRLLRQRDSKRSWSSRFASKRHGSDTQCWRVLRSNPPSKPTINCWVRPMHGSEILKLLVWRTAARDKWDCQRLLSRKQIWIIILPQSFLTIIHANYSWFFIRLFLICTNTDSGPCCISKNIFWAGLILNRSILTFFYLKLYYINPVKKCGDSLLLHFEHT